MIPRTFLILSGVVLGLFLGEFVLRLVMPMTLNFGKEQVKKFDEEVAFFEYDQVLGWKGKPFAAGIQKGQQFSISVRHNSQGFREQEIPYEKTDGRIRILVLGDSQTWGSGVKQEERFTEVLEDLLHQKGVDAEVFNLGVVGYGTDQEFLLYRRVGARYHPDIVILAFFWNDLFENFTSVAYGYPKSKFVEAPDGSLELRNVPVPERIGGQEEARASLRRNLKNWLEENSIIFRLLANAVRHDPYLYPFTVQVGLAGGPPRDPESGQWKITRYLLEEFKETVKEGGSDFFVVIIPESSDLETATHSLRQPLIRELKDLPALDLVSALKADGQLGRLYYPNDIHLNTKGHRAIGQSLFRYVTDRGLV